MDTTDHPSREDLENLVEAEKERLDEIDLDDKAVPTLNDTLTEEDLEEEIAWRNAAYNSSHGLHGEDRE